MLVGGWNGLDSEQFGARHGPPRGLDHELNRMPATHTEVRVREAVAIEYEFGVCVAFRELGGVDECELGVHCGVDDTKPGQAVCMPMTDTARTTIRLLCVL